MLGGVYHLSPSLGVEPVDLPHPHSCLTGGLALPHIP